jgi:hypothetical protein
MVDFRKWLIALAAIAVLIAFGGPSAYASTDNPMTCTAQAADPHLIRTEGITELVGDILITCTGGIPTPAGQPIPQSNITLGLNTQITSRLLGKGYIDALLLIDEPVTTVAANQNPPATQWPRPPSSPPQSVCFANSSNSTDQPGCNAELGTFNGVGQGLPGAAPSPYQTQPNIFVARTVDAFHITWLGVPIDAPGSTGSRVIRITDVRANACNLGLSATPVDTQVVAFIAANGSPNVNLTNPQNTVAFIRQGLIVAGQNTGLQQCNNLNVGGGGVGGNFFAGSGVGIAVTNVNVREGFAASFKRHSIPVLGTTSIPLGGAPDGQQNAVGFAYNTESGFDPQGTNPIGTHFGQSDAATRILLRFSNIGVGARILVPTVVALTLDNASTPGTPDLPSSGTGGWTGGFLQLRSGSVDQQGNLPNPFGFATPTSTFSNSSFFFSSGPFKGPGAVAPFNGAVEIIASGGGTATALYEVVNADPHGVEQANIPIGVAFISNTAQNIPNPGQTQVAVSFAPLSNVNTASGSDPIPRFCDSPPHVLNTFHIDVCQCNLLFPFVTNQSGFDTGVAIANTTTDPYGTTPQNGLVTLFFYGNTPGGGNCVPKMTTTSPVLTGTELIFTLSAGGNYGIAANAGCQGYMFAIANFQYCHAFAFISDVGAQKLAEGYLAIQIDIYGGTGLNRTGITGEVQGH